MDCSCPSSRLKALPTSWQAQPPSRSSRQSFQDASFRGLDPLRLLRRAFASNAAFFLVEWVLLGWRPSAAAVLLFFHSTVLGAIAISSFWSLLNERFDAHSALTGRPVFTGEPMAVMIHHARTPAPRFSNAAGHPLPERLEQIVLACLEKSPERRPSSAVELWRQLGELTIATPWTSERAESWWRDHLPELTQPSPAGDSSSDVKIARVE